METRASYIVVGSFVLALAAVAVAIAIWLARVQLAEAPNPYLIRFTGDVTGLSIGSPVRYRGVPVGNVTDIRIDPGNVELTRVEVELRHGTPVKEDTVAEIAAQGITGVAFIQLTGGTQASPTLASKDRRHLPEIRSRPSALQEVLARLPQVFERAVLLGDRLAKLLDERNLESVSQTLENLRRLSESMNSEQGDMRQLLREGREALSVLGQLAIESRAVAAKIDDQVVPVAEGARETLEALRQATVTMRDVARQIEAVVDENRAPLRDFSNVGLRELGQFAAEARILVDSLIRLSQQIERDPARFFFGDTQKGYRAP